MEDSSSSRASLTILGGSKAGQSFLVEDSVDNIVIGSDPSCRFQIDLPGVSPVHARIWIDPEGVTVYETNSPRGLYVNDDRVVAQAPLRNGDILWLGTPGDEDVVMIQCRFPHARGERPAYTPPPLDEDAPSETLALGTRVPAAERAPEAEPGAPEAEPEPEEAPAAEAAPEEGVPEEAALPGAEAVPEQAEPAIGAAAEAAEASRPGAEEQPPEETGIAPMAEVSAPPPAPPTEVLMFEDEPARAEPPPTAAFVPAAAKFDVDFSKPSLPSGFEEEIEDTVADAPAPGRRPQPPAIEPPAPPAVVAPLPPPPQARVEAPAPPPAPPSRGDTPAPGRAGAPQPPPPPPRRSAPRPAPRAAQAPAAAEGPRPGLPAAARWGGLAAAVVLVAAGSYLGVRMMRGPQAAATPAPPLAVPATQPAVSPAVAELAVEPPSAPEAPPTAPPIQEEVTIVTQPPATTLAAAPSQRPSAAPSQRPPATPAPGARATPTARPTQRAAASAPPPPAAVEAPAVPLAGQVAGLLGQAEAAARGRNFEAAIRAYDDVLRLDPQNGRATQGKAAAQAGAVSLMRSFAAGRTSLSGKAAQAGDLGGFDTTGVKVAKVADYSGRVEFEVQPPRVLAGDTYTVRIFLVNDGKKAFKVASVTVNTTTNGSRSGGAVPVRTRELEPRDRMLLDERTAEWPAGVNSWTLEAVVQTDRDAAFTSRLNWR